MKSLFSFLLITCLISSTYAKKPDTRYFELRIYNCYPGRLDALIERFRNHTIRIFNKHGMESIGYWLPTDNKENALYYVLAYPSKEARATSWDAFHNDPEWKEASSKSEESGKIVEKVTSVFMNAAEISPAIQASTSGADRVFELRTYFCFPGRLPNLTQRFRDHTMKLFTKHNMTNIAYWTPMDSTGVQSRLLYIIAHPSESEAKKSWEEFNNDPVWIKAKADSEKDGKIVEKVESVFLKPLDYSKIK